VADLLIAIDRHRPDGRAAESSASAQARAEAQVWDILAERLRARLHAGPLAAATAATLDEVAGHRLDPYAAADRLLAAADRVGDPGADGAG
jgi:hypothetical protein